MFYNIRKMPIPEDAIITEESGKNYKVWYKELDEEIMTIEEIKSKYNGYWILIANRERDSEGRLLKGKPVVISNLVNGGVDSGVYEKYYSEEYKVTCDLQFMISDTFKLEGVEYYED